MNRCGQDDPMLLLQRTFSMLFPLRKWACSLKSVTSELQLVISQTAPKFRIYKYCEATKYRITFINFKILYFSFLSNIPSYYYHRFGCIHIQSGCQQQVQQYGKVHILQKLPSKDFHNLNKFLYITHKPR